MERRDYSQFMQPSEPKVLYAAVAIIRLRNDNAQNATMNANPIPLSPSTNAPVMSSSET